MKRFFLAALAALILSTAGMAGDNVAYCEEVTPGVRQRCVFEFDAASPADAPYSPYFPVPQYGGSDNPVALMVAVPATYQVHDTALSLNDSLRLVGARMIHEGTVVPLSVGVRQKLVEDFVQEARGAVNYSRSQRGQRQTVAESITYLEGLNAP